VIPNSGANDGARRGLVPGKDAALSPLMATGGSAGGATKALAEPPLFMRTVSRDEVALSKSASRNAEDEDLLPTSSSPRASVASRIKPDEDMAVRMRSMVERINALTEEDLRYVRIVCGWNRWERCHCVLL
jgi:hypothetical protein